MSETPSRELRTWGDGWRCDECCNGDRCDDPTHSERSKCPHCKGTGLALWNIYEKEREFGKLKSELAAAKRDAHRASSIGIAMILAHFQNPSGYQKELQEELRLIWSRNKPLEIARDPLFDAAIATREGGPET